MEVAEAAAAAEEEIEMEIRSGPWVGQTIWLRNVEGDLLGIRIKIL